VAEVIDAAQERAIRLRVESKRTLKHALQYYLEFEPEFAWSSFPEVVQRGYVSSSDIERITEAQAQSLVPMLADSVRYFTRRDKKERAKDPATIDGDSGDLGCASEFAYKAQLWSDALRNLCDAFGLDCPL
jgi:hypothetical protein